MSWEEMFVIQVIETSTGEVVKTSERPMPRKQIERVDDGMNRNLDHVRYHTKIVPHKDSKGSKS